MDCNTSEYSLNQNLRAMARVSGLLVGLPIVAVGAESHTEQAIRCGAENGHMTFENFMQASIGVDSCGLPAIRVKFIDSCDVQLNCTNNDDVNYLNQLFAYDSTLKTYALVINQST